MSIEQMKENIKGEWKSIAPELRPSQTKNADGSMKPFYLSRAFTYSPDDTFKLEVINSADPFGKIPLVSIMLEGHIAWRGDHPITPGAQKADFITDIAYDATPLHQSFADAMNTSASSGFDKWAVGGTQSVMKKAFAPFGLKEGEVFGEYDLIYLHGDMLFWGARNVDGRGFDTEENRPTNLQIPLVRV
jgi:hypothetical protein